MHVASFSILCHWLESKSKYNTVCSWGAHFRRDAVAYLSRGNMLLHFVGFYAFWQELNEVDNKLRTPATQYQESFLYATVENEVFSINTQQQKLSCCPLSIKHYIDSFEYFLNRLFWCFPNLILSQFMKEVEADLKYFIAL